MDAGFGEFMVTKMITKRWENLRRDIPKMCMAAGVKDPCAVTLAAVCSILGAEACLAKQLGTNIDIMAAAKVIKADLDEVEEMSEEDLLHAIVEAQNGED